MSELFKFHIQGPDADKLAEEFADLFENEFGYRPIAVDTNEKRGKDEKNIDPGMVGAYAGLAAAVLSLPASLLAVKDLVEHITKAEKLERIIDWSRKKRTKNRDISFRMENKKGFLFEFDMSTSTEIIEEASVKKDNDKESQKE